MPLSRTALLVLAALALGVTACGSYKKDLQLICDAASLPEAQVADPAERATLMAQHLQKNLRSSEAKKLMSGLGHVSSEDKAKILESEAARVGITRCAITEEMHQAARQQKAAAEQVE